MSDTTTRNARCHCGSGKKFKNCHGANMTAPAGRKIPTVYYFIAAAVLVVALLAVWKQADKPAPGRVWSEEHGHWHDVP